MDLVFCLFVQLFAMAIFLRIIGWPRTVRPRSAEILVCAPELERARAKSSGRGSVRLYRDHYYQRALPTESGAGPLHERRSHMPRVILPHD